MWERMCLIVNSIFGKGVSVATQETTAYEVEDGAIS